MTNEIKNKPLNATEARAISDKFKRDVDNALEEISVYIKEAAENGENLIEYTVSTNSQKVYNVYNEVANILSDELDYEVLLLQARGTADGFELSIKW